MNVFVFSPAFPNATHAQKLRQLRLWRDVELARTDWTQVADAPVDATAWAVYRQALRDLPAAIDITNPVLPDRPEGS